MNTPLVVDRAAQGVLRARLTRPAERNTPTVDPLDARDNAIAVLMELSPCALRSCKVSIHASGDTDLGTAHRSGVEAPSALMRSADWPQSRGAFVNERRPAFGIYFKRDM